MREEREIIQLKPLVTVNGKHEKNILYKVADAGTVQFVEEHKDTGGREIVDLVYCLKTEQYGIFAKEYRNPAVPKSYKTADVLACVVDDTNKKIYTTIFDVKRNISAFSDDLLKNNAMLTAIKEVRDFIEQLHDEVLHKNSFMLYYKDAGYEEEEKLGLVTRNFEEQKFIAVANLLEQRLKNTEDKNARLVALKLKNNLRAYKGEEEKLRAFADKKIKISGNTYPLHVFLLEKVSDLEYKTFIKLMASDELKS